MADSDESIFRDLYARMNETDKNLSNLVGQTTVITQQNEHLIGLLKFVLKFLCGIIIVLIAALVYGAIGSEGFNAVKNIPTVAVQCPVPNTSCGSDELDHFFRNMPTSV